MKSKYLLPFIAVALVMAMTLTAGCTSLYNSQEKTTTPSYSGESSGYAPSYPSPDYNDGQYKSSGDYSYPATSATSSPVAYSDIANRKVIMTAYVQIETSNLDSAVTQVRSLATGAGGYVQSSSLNVFDDNRKTCTVSIKVPQSAYESTLTEIRKLGTVKADRSSGSDVTSQYVDLTARLKNKKVEEARLLDIMAKANNTADILSVERELSRVQGEIESTQGQLNLLNNQVDFSTITVYITEPQPVVAYDWGLGTAFADAIHGFVATIGGLIVITGYLIPLVLYFVLCVLAIYAIVKIAIWIYRRIKQPKKNDVEEKKP